MFFKLLLTNSFRETGYSQYSVLFVPHNDLKGCIATQIVLFYNINSLAPTVIYLVLHIFNTCLTSLNFCLCHPGLFHILLSKKFFLNKKHQIINMFACQYICLILFHLAIHSTHYFYNQDFGKHKFYFKGV